MASTIRDKDIYKMTSVPRGFCVIINTINFEGDEKKTRNDSIKGVDLICKAFEKLQFTVKIWIDLSDVDIKKKIKELYDRKECEGHDCFVLYVSSHGDNESFSTSNNKHITFDEIIRMFTDKKCKKFAKKPKIIFFDCCRGSKHSFSYDMSDEADYVPDRNTVYSDLFVCYSTIKDLISMRGWLAICLNDCLLKYANNTDFMDIVVETNRLLQTRISRSKDELHTQSLECDCIAKNKKKLYFNISIREEEISNQESTVNDSEMVENSRHIELNYNKVKVDENYKIEFDKSEQLDLKCLFNIIGKENGNKHFNIMLLENRFIKKIEENILDQISFNEIIIVNCEKLTKIHWNAFGKITSQIKKFSVCNNKLLMRNTNTDYDLMKLINALANCEEILMKPFDSTLERIKLPKLKILILNGLNSSIKISKIEDYAFIECDQIEMIDLRNNNINFISKKAFHFSNSNSNNKKELVLWIGNDKNQNDNKSRNELKEESFEEDSLTNFERPVKLIIDGTRIEYLKKNIFKPFFEKNPENKVVVDSHTFDMNLLHKKNRWIKGLTSNFTNRIRKGKLT